MQDDTHVPVLPDAFVDALCHDADGHYVDATFGRGGHSRTILGRLSRHGRLLGLDRDPAAVQAGRQLEREDTRFCIVHADFAELEAVLDAHEWETVAGIGFDLGASSPQLEDPSRGFSFQYAGPLDMRMNPESGEALAQRLAHTSERELETIIRQYGGERFARRIAQAILNALHDGRLATTRDLEHACFHAVPRHARHGRTHPATRTFQALRIWVNDEMTQLRAGLETAMRRLAPHGRLGVIAFHSGEDRLVRDVIEAQVNACICPPDFPVCTCGRAPTMRWVNKKPIRPAADEIIANPRSRSARLRVAERLA